MRLLQLAYTDARLTLECNLADLGIEEETDDRPQRVSAIPLLRPGAWYAESQGAAPATYRMRGRLALAPAAGAAAAETARANLMRMMAAARAMTYLDRTVSIDDMDMRVATDVTLDRVLVARWNIQSPDLIDGRPIAARRWSMTLQVVQGA